MRKKISVILIAVLVAVLGTSTCFIIDYSKEENKQAELCPHPCEAPRSPVPDTRPLLLTPHYKKNLPIRSQRRIRGVFLIYFELNALVSYFLNSLAI